MCYKIASNIVNPQKEKGKRQEEWKGKKARKKGENKGGKARKGWGEKGGQDNGVFGGAARGERRITLHGDRKPFRLPWDYGN